jgi:hypothetical protein
VARRFVLLLLALSIGLMGAGSCTFASNTSNKDDEKQSGSGVLVVVGTAENRARGDGESDSSRGEAAVIRTVLAESVLSLPARSTVPAPDRVDFEIAAPERFASIAQAPVLRRSNTVSAVPEPTAALSFAVGASLMAWRLRRGRFRT